MHSTVLSVTYLPTLMIKYLNYPIGRNIITDISNGCSISIAHEQSYKQFNVRMITTELQFTSFETNLGNARTKSLPHPYSVRDLLLDCLFFHTTLKVLCYQFYPCHWVQLPFAVIRALVRVAKGRQLSQIE